MLRLRFVFILLPVLFPVYFISAQDSGEVDHTARLDVFEKAIAREGAVSAEEFGEMEALYQELLVSPHYEEVIRLRQLLSRGYEKNRMIRGEVNADVIKGLAARQDEDSRQAEKRETAIAAGLITSGSVAAASLIAFNVFWYLSEDAFSQYVAARNTAEASYRMSRWQTFDLISYISLGTATAGLGTASLLLALAEPQRRVVADNRYLGDWTPSASREDQVYSLEQARSNLTELYRKDAGSRTGLTVASYSFLGLGAVALGGMVTGLVLADQARTQLEADPGRSDAPELQERADMMNLIAIVSGGTGVVSLSLSGMFALLRPDPERHVSAIEEIDLRLESLLRE